jgi:pimeloyl-ACP methyl ester carboxylesterase
MVHGTAPGAGGVCRRPDARRPPRACVTLTGLGERAHLMSSSITLETHISDVVNAIDAEEMDDVVLVVHSYAGMLGTAVADRMPKRLKHLVYVDAVVPRPGESWSSTHASATRQRGWLRPRPRRTSVSRRQTLRYSVWSRKTMPGCNAGRPRIRVTPTKRHCTSTPYG